MTTADLLTPDEIVELKKQGPAVNDFIFNLPVDASAALIRSELRRVFLKPKTLQEKLRVIADHLPGPSPFDDKDGSARDVVMQAAAYIDSIEAQTKLHPIDDLCKIRFGHPHRWVILWGPSGHSSIGLRCSVGRLAPPGHKFEDDYTIHDGERFTDSGLSPTHFSELLYSRLP